MIHAEDITVTCHSRKKFYNGKDVYWYSFNGLQSPLQIPPKFLNVADTKYYEYGGSHEEALQSWKDKGVTNIVEGDEL